MDRQKQLRDIFKSVKEIKDIKEKNTCLFFRLQRKRFLLEAWFVEKFFIERKTNKEIKQELFINSETTYFRKKKKIINFYEKLSIW